MLLAQLKLELDHLEIRVDEADALIEKTACENEACQRLVAIPGTKDWPVIIGSRKLRFFWCQLQVCSSSDKNCYRSLLD